MPQSPFYNKSKDPLHSAPAWLCPHPNQKLTHVSAPGDYVLHNNSCILWGFTLNNAINKATMSIYDGIDINGVLVGNFDIAAGEQSFIFPGGGAYLRNGCFVHVVSTPDLTFISGEK